MPEIPPASRVPSGDKDLSDLQSTTTQSQDLEQLLDLTASAAARYVDYLLVHEQSFRLIQQLTEFHAAICQARETLQQNSDLDSITIPAGEATTSTSNPTDLQDGSETEKTSEVDGSQEDGNATETTLEVDKSQEDGSATETTLEVDGSQDESTTEKNSEEAEIDDLEKETTVSELAALREVEEEKEFLEGDYVLARGGIRKLLKELMIVQAKAEPKIDDIEHLSLLDLEVEEMPACKGEKEVTDSKADSEEFLVPLVKMVEKLEAVVHDLLPRIKPRPQKSKPEEDGDKVISDDETAKEEEVCTCHLNSKEDDKSSSKTDETTANKNKEPMELATYVRQMLEMNTSLQAKVADCPSLADEIVNTIVSKSENIEAVADIHLMRVASTLTPQGAKEVLKALPSGSRDTYALAIRAIESQSAPDRDLAKRVLIWLTHPMRQLTASELQHALFPELVDASDSSQLDNCTTEIRRVCYGLIILEPEEENMKATFAHPTVKQYLLDDCKAFFSDIHYSMALDCIRYLMLPAINKGCTQALGNRLELKKFLGYASFHWAKHSRRVTPENSAMMKKAIIKFLGRTGSVSSAIQVVQGAMWPNSWATSLRVMSHFRSQAKKRILATAFFKLNDLAIAEVEVRASKVTNIKDNQGQSLLSIAAMMDNLPLVKVLLAKSDIEADAKDNADRTPLLWAAASGARVEILKLLLDRPDVNPDPKNTIGQTALSWAASGGHTHAVEILLAKGPEVDSNNKEISGATPLSLAAKGGHVDVVRKLINHPGIDLEMKTGYGRTALGWAAVYGHSEIVRLLLEKGATWDTTDESGSTPLTLAAKGGFLDTVKLLLEQDGINADVTEQDGATPLSLAAQGGHTEIAKLLLTRSDVNPDSKDSFDRTPLKWACREESVEIARMLLEIEKVDPNSRDRAWGGYTPLHSAADRGNFEIVKLLLERPDIQADLPDDRANTPLLEAIWRGNTNIVELLLSRKDVDPDKKGDGERTPLMLAASRGWVEIFKILLSRAPKEVDINAVDNSRQNALYHASFHGFSEMVGLLLAQEGVEVNTLDNVGDTALGIAVEYCYPEVVKLFLAREDVDPDLPYGRSLRTPLGWAAYVGNHEIINLLLDTGRVNVNHQDAEGGSPLLLGIRNIGDDEIRNRLLECEGIDVTLRDNEGRTALSYAAQMGCVEAVQTLVDPSKPWAGKVDLDERDNFQRTPLWWAANSYRKGVVEYLLGTGKVTLDAQDNHGTTPLCIAAWHGCVDIVELLLACEDVNPAIKDNDGDTVLLCAAGAGRDDIVKILLEHPLADPEEKNNAGRTALACAANAGYVEVLPLLLEYRGPHPQISPDIRYVDPDSRTNDGQTPLSLAAGLGRLDVVEYLLALDDGKAVNPNSKCDAGRTPLSYAAENARFEVVKLLMERDDVNYYIKDNEGHTPRWWSKQLFGGGQSSVAVVGLFNRYKPGHP